MKTSDQKKKVLVVDDDPGHVKLLNDVLTDKGYQVLKSTEAAEGLELALKNNPDIILLDVMMPIINGYNFCRLLKSENEKNDIPVIFLTSRDTKEDMEIGREMGANAYLTKPVDMNELLNTMEQLLK